MNNLCNKFRYSSLWS